MGLLKLLFGTSTENKVPTESDDDSKKGIFEGGDELTIEDMCIIDILDGDD